MVSNDIQWRFSHIDAENIRRNEAPSQIFAIFKKLIGGILISELKGRVIN
jgi:hypothetical protein